MKSLKISQLPTKVGKQVTLKGWVEVVRNQKSMQFLVLRDTSGLVQCAFQRGSNQSIEDSLLSLTQDSTVTVSGRVVTNPNIRLGGLEIQLESLVIHSIAEPLPIRPETSFEKKMDYRWIDLRSPQNLLILQVQTLTEAAMREYWYQNGFIEIHSPKLLQTASESGSELFELPYFGTTAYLAQSPQFYKQMAMAAGLDKIFEIGPVFRANPSFTSRHDTEFTSVDVEISWIDSHDDVMLFEERWIQYFMQSIADNFGDQIKELFGVEVEVPVLPFPRISMADAVKIVHQTGYKVPAETKGDLDPQAERILASYVQKQFGHQFVFVTDYPTSVRPFYHMRHPNDLSLTMSFDLLFQGLEITTGAQREHRYDILCQQALEKGMSLEPVQFYLDFFRYGIPPHGGFGFGLTRLLMQLLGLENVRQVTYLYRGPNRLTP